MEKIWQWVEKIRLYKWLNGHRLFGKIFNREVLSYLLFGALTTVVSLVTFWIPTRLFSLACRVSGRRALRHTFRKKLRLH